MLKYLPLVALFIAAPALAQQAPQHTFLRTDSQVQDQCTAQEAQVTLGQKQIADLQKQIVDLQQQIATMKVLSSKSKIP